MVKTIKLIGTLKYSDDIEEVMSVEEYIKNATEKGYKIEVERMVGNVMTAMRIYKEVEYKERKQNDSKEM